MNRFSDKNIKGIKITLPWGRRGIDVYEAADYVHTRICINIYDMYMHMYSFVPHAFAGTRVKSSSIGSTIRGFDQRDSSGYAHP